MRKLASLGLAAGALLLACTENDFVVWSSTAGAGGQAGSAGNAGSGGISGADTGASGASGGGSDEVTDAGTAGDAGVDGGTPCSDTSECPPSWTCEKAACSDATGVCEPRPVFCPAEPLPVCGCDQVTYWNDCVRRQSGAPASLGSEECRSGARTCNTGADCGVPNASCARIAPPPGPDAGAFCDPNAPGVCWVAPSRCEPSADPLRWHLCMPHNGEPPPPCVDTCIAIVSELPHVPPRHDDSCF